MIGGGYRWFYEELSERVIKDKIEKSMELGQGYAQDFADYRYACGVLVGLDLALEFAETIKKEQDAA